MTVLLYILLLITEYRGQVVFNGVPVPGATVTATQGGKKFTAITDPMGVYVFSDLPEGTWAIEIEMQGFVPLKGGDTSTSTWELKMLPVEEIKAESAHNESATPAPAPGAAANPSAPKTPVDNARRQTGFQRTEVIESNNGSSAPQPGAEAPASAFANVSQDELNQRAVDGLLINGSVNNGAASPFGQLGGFGNNRRGVRPPVYRRHRRHRR